MYSQESDNQYLKYLPAAAGGASLVTFVSVSPLLANSSIPDASDVNTAVTGLTAVAASGAGIVLGVMGVRIAIKLVNRLSAKG